MITTNVLDTARGLPVEGMTVILYRLDGADGEEIASGVTDADGHLEANVTVASTEAFYELEYISGSYFESLGTPTFYDVITIRFRVDSPDEDYHIPLLLSPFGYTTFRG